MRRAHLVLRVGPRLADLMQVGLEGRAALVRHLGRALRTVGTCRGLCEPAALLHVSILEAAQLGRQRRVALLQLAMLDLQCRVR